MLLLSSLLCALAGYVSAFLVEISSLTDLYPPLWQGCPGQLSDYRVEDGMYTINPWLYPERMGIYKILITFTAEYFERFAPNNEANILWGLPLQHGWQYETGRLADPTSETECGKENGDDTCISVNSWWACMNYYLCALPFFGAVEAGVLGISSDQVKLSPPPKDQMYFCYNVTACRSSFPDAMTKWNTFFQQVKESSKSLDDLLKYLWDAHIASLEAARSIFDNRNLYFPKPESDFAEGWSNAVDYIAAIRFETTLKKMNKFQKYLPPRLLKSDDYPLFIKDFTDSQNRILFLINLINKIDNDSGHKFLSLFRNLMKSEYLRKMVNELMEQLTENYNISPQELAIIFSEYI
ncbi:protein LEG1 homolog [Phascolarctos cinereus]|uniref:Protein LEG1 homolog n=1 Tax=Phascolarctos cinereus TaxID=38626 RepID=A0A6P5KDL0_PHACI|nr:protein LEG1 homolog [Phascolarctos cinereus]